VDNRAPSKCRGRSFRYHATMQRIPLGQRMTRIALLAASATALATTCAFSESQPVSSSPNNEWTWIAGLVGGILGASFKAIYDYIAYRWQRPLLVPVFYPSEEGCAVETDAKGKDRDDKDVVVRQRYLRLRIKNDGRSAAENVTASVIKISFKEPGATPTTFREEVLNLKVSLTEDHPVRIPAGAHVFMDVFFTVRGKEPHGERSAVVAYGFEFRANPVRLQTFGFGIGSYAADLFVSADGAPTRLVEIKWTWDGTFDGLRAQSLGHKFLA